MFCFYVKVLPAEGGSQQLPAEVRSRQLPAEGLAAAASFNLAASGPKQGPENHKIGLT